eukprot:gb/GEZN01021386.1/.p1 GENE.gb/GEZN01021386.1/~~gb/GEZN01021386.1/.p1  ORF type:complete len:142 (-),score=16.51 gb/GEZN01021386.1/:227-631(-)
MLSRGSLTQLSSICGLHQPLRLLTQQSVRFGGKHRSFYLKNNQYLYLKMVDEYAPDFQERLDWFCEYPTRGKESTQRGYKDTVHCSKTAYYEKPKLAKQRFVHGKRIRERKKAITEVVRAYLYDVNKDCGYMPR